VVAVIKDVLDVAIVQGAVLYELLRHSTTSKGCPTVGAKLKPPLTVKEAVIVPDE
jgi:hypothetical protein